MSTMGPGGSQSITDASFRPVMPYSEVLTKATKGPLKDIKKFRNNDLIAQKCTVVRSTTPSKSYNANSTGLPDDGGLRGGSVDTKGV